ncbi:peptidoglycan recognition protein family protein [Streptomyces cathayae]|uniref:Peptidoglycan recognition protein n=1 Tax=Streptomyces cathayae TaxID=3031124 RepID=A0ABY8K3W9_9ACTN|nr:peptidoglycan recognition protein [Streptomyces sp. HUAS 5]WGD42552.1 peptidoglycan recognition protein [Streptomyces sp. HUAS 5]
MHRIPASVIGVTCATALVLPLAPSAVAASAGPGQPARAVPRAAVTAESGTTGSTESLPLQPLDPDRASGAATFGLTPRSVRNFSLLGVVWDDPAAELHGQVQVRTRGARTGSWSDWRDVEARNADHAADPGTSGTGERASGRVRGATAPLWVGDSDGVEIRVLAESGGPGHTGTAAEGPESAEAAESTVLPLPSGMRLELIDPGEGSASAAGTADGPADGTGVRRKGAVTRQRANPYTAPRPDIVTRADWGADESLREKGFVYTDEVGAAFVHHTASGNDYTCEEVPSLIRGIYRYHTESMGWRDLGYNFLVDKCGKVYEGRAGGVAEPVLGAHTLGFNSHSMGVAVLGTYSSTDPSDAAVKGVARLAAWKLGLYGVDPGAETYLTSEGGNLYTKGTRVRLNVISGHRDGFNTVCPGGKLYDQLGTARSTAAGYQGR